MTALLSPFALPMRWAKSCLRHPKSESRAYRSSFIFDGGGGETLLGIMNPLSASNVKTTLNTRKDSTRCPQHPRPAPSGAGRSAGAGSGGQPPSGFAKRLSPLRFREQDRDGQVECKILNHGAS